MLFLRVQVVVIVKEYYSYTFYVGVSNVISFEGCQEREKALPGSVKNLSMKWTELERSLEIGKKLNVTLMLRNEENQRNSEQNVIEKKKEMANHPEEVENRKRRKENLCSDKKQKKIAKKCVGINFLSEEEWCI